MECEFDIKIKCVSTRYMYMYIYTYIDHLSKEVCRHYNRYVYSQSTLISLTNRALSGAMYKHTTPVAFHFMDTYIKPSPPICVNLMYSHGHLIN